MRSVKGLSYHFIALSGCGVCVLLLQPAVLVFFPRFFAVRMSTKEEENVPPEFFTPEQQAWIENLIAKCAGKKGVLVENTTGATASNFN